MNAAIRIIGLFFIFLIGCDELKDSTRANDSSYVIMEELTQRGYLWHLDHYRREDARQLIETSVYNACQKK